jgi:uncharacterized damage-inducible protein DinB
MGEDIKQKLRDMLERSHSELLETVQEFDLEETIYKDSGWRGREMLSHIGAWDRVIAKSLVELTNETEYLIPDFDEDQFNDQTAKAQQAMSTEEVIADWKLARKELIEAVAKTPIEKFSREFQYPWRDERGNIYDLVTYFVDHDIEHKKEMVNLIKTSDG